MKTDQQEEAKASQQADDGAAQKPKRERKPKAKAQGDAKNAQGGGKGLVYRVKGEENKEEPAKQRPQTADASGDQKPKKKRAPKKGGDDAEEGKAEG